MKCSYMDDRTNNTYGYNFSIFFSFTFEYDSSINQSIENTILLMKNQQKKNYDKNS